MSLNDHYVGVLDHWLKSRLESVHTAIPAKVVAYDAGTQRGVVQPLIRHCSINGRKTTLPEIKNVPFVFPTTAMGGLLLPVNPSDQVLLVFAEAETGTYKASDGSAPVDADSPLRFGLANAIAVVGLWATPPQDHNGDDTILYHGRQKLALKQDGGIALENDHGTIEIDSIGRMVISNGVSGIKKELEALWDALDRAMAQLEALATASAALIPPAGAVATAVTALQTTNAIRKAAIQNIFKE